MSGTPEPRPDPTLVATLAMAHRWCREIRAGHSIAAIAARDGHATSFVRTRAPLAFLAPGIQAAILAGTQPPCLTIDQILRIAMPLDWRGQERLLGLHAE